MLLRRILAGWDMPAAWLACGLLIAGLASPTKADTTFVSGTIHFNTTWTPAGNPYVIIGGTRVDTGVVLTILPGVSARLNPGVNLRIDGGLYAVGAPGDSIIFAPASGGTWGTLSFTASSIDSACCLEYCRIEKAGGGIIFEQSSPLIRFCEIRDGGTVVVQTGSAPRVLFSTISGIQSASGGGTLCGGAFRLDAGSAPELRGNVITGNSVFVWGYNNSASGGGICVYTDSAVIVENTLSNNSADAANRAGFGGAIAVHDCSPLIACNTVSNNSSGAGAAIYVGGDASPVITCNTIVGNTTGAVHMWYSPPNASLVFTLNNVYDNHNFLQSIFEVYSGLGSAPLAMENNWWGTTDPGQIDLLVYDFWDDPSLREIDFIPFSSGTNTPPANSMVVILPNGGEEWYYDEIQKIRWNPFCLTGDVKIEYSVDSGSTWLIIAESARNCGIYAWKVPFIKSMGCRVRVSASTGGTPADESDSNFAICPTADLCRCNCPKQGDINGDGVIDVFDVIDAIGIAFSGGTDPWDPACPTTRGDVDNNGVTDVFDVIYLIATAFSGGPGPVDPCI